MTGVVSRGPMQSAVIRPHESWRTTVCVASGPSLTEAQCALIAAAQAAGKCRVIVCNNTWQRLPGADALWATDGKWWRQYVKDVAGGFAGELWTCDQKAAQDIGLCYAKGASRPGLCRDPADGVHHGGNSGYAQIGLAYHFGARRIILAGYDMKRSPTGRLHWHPDHPQGWGNATNMSMFAPHYLRLYEDLVAAGCEMVNASIETAITSIPRADLAATLAAL